MGEFEKECVQLRERLKAVLAAHTRLQEEFATLKDEFERRGQVIGALQKRLFGSSSERIDPLQTNLQFEEGEKLLGKSEPAGEGGGSEDKGEGQQDGPAKPPRERRGKKDLFPRNLPILSEETIIPREVLANPGDYVEIGEEPPHDELEVVRSRVGWKRTRRKKYKLRDDRGKPPVVAPAPLPSIPGTLCGPVLMSQLIVDKHLDHLPHYRQAARMLRQSGVELSRGTINAWVHAAAEHLKPIGEAIKCSLARSRILQIDETPMKYLNPGLGKAAQGYLWVYRDPETGVAWFDWRLGRGADCLEEVLGRDAAGNLLWDVEIIQCDGHAAYLALSNKSAGLRLAACLAHIRRKFTEAMDESPRFAGPVLEGIQRLYRIEHWFGQNNTSLACRQLIRQTRSRGECERLLGKIMGLDKRGFLPQSRIGKAITHALGRWNELETCLGDARLPIDNNLVENAIRPAKPGLKNYLFFGSAEAGVNNALLYTLIDNCKAVNINPELYFEEVFRRLPVDATPEQAAGLTPGRLALEIQSREELRQTA